MARSGPGGADAAWIKLAGAGCQRQGQREPLPGSLLSSMAPWCAGQLGSNGKADTSSGDLRGLGTAPQPVEHVRLVFWADPGAAVADLEPGLAAGLGQEHLDPPAGWREFDSVAEQVGDDLMQAAWVGQDRCQLKLALEADPGGGEAGLPVLGRSRGDLAGLSA